VKRIACKEEGEKVYVEFVDYRNKNQLKDFYKIFKKGSGYLVLEYKETEESVIAVTTNDKDSIVLEWEPSHGCHLRADRADAKRLIEIVFKMLCYRYKSFCSYQNMLGGFADFESADKMGDIDASNPDYASDDSEIIEAINDLLALAKGSEGLKAPLP
jgi:hypothetical protein